jgi:hypothetical protein
MAVIPLQTYGCFTQSILIAGSCTCDGQTRTNLSLGQSGKVKGMRFDSFEYIYHALDGQSGDVLELKAAPTQAVK